MKSGHLSAFFHTKTERYPFLQRDYVSPYNIGIFN